jgi:hypothetical protein
MFNKKNLVRFLLMHGALNLPRKGTQERDVLKEWLEGGVRWIDSCFDPKAGEADEIKQAQQRREACLTPSGLARERG